MARCHFCNGVMSKVYATYKDHGGPGPTKETCEACFDRRAVAPLSTGQYLLHVHRDMGLETALSPRGDIGQWVMYVGDDLDKVEELKPFVALTIQNREG